MTGVFPTLPEPTAKIPLSKPFKFKQFSVHQDRCAMKIGTDSVILGAWTDLAHRPRSILDIGAGTGILALMLAQRSLADTIDAIEIEEGAYEQCVGNFEASPWADRLFCYHAGLDEFMEEFEDPYDLIISNPPFFTEAVASADASRDRARQNRSLPFEELLEGASALLSEQGLFSTVVPVKEETGFIRLAAAVGLYPNSILRVRGNPSAVLKRSFIAFRFEERAPVETEMTIELERHVHTREYIRLTQAFYLNM